MRRIPDRVRGFGRLAALLAIALAVGCASAGSPEASQSDPATAARADGAPDSESREVSAVERGLVGESGFASRTRQSLTLWVETDDDVMLGGFEAVLRFDARVARIERLDALAPFEVAALASQFAHGRVKLLATVAVGATVRGPRAVATLRWIAPPTTRLSEFAAIVLESVAAYSPAPDAGPIRARVWLAPARLLPRREITDARSR